MILESREKHSRSLTKAITYRVLSILADSIVAYLITKNVYQTVGIVSLVNLYSTALYHFHERIWAHIRWGTK